MNLQCAVIEGEQRIKLGLGKGLRPKIAVLVRQGVRYALDELPRRVVLPTYVGSEVVPLIQPASGRLPMSLGA